MEEYLLVEYADNWADEIDVEGFFTTTKKNYDDFVLRVQKYFKNQSELSYYIGTNEEIIYEGSEHVLGAFRITPITEEQYKTLWELFMTDDKGEVGNVYFGFTGPDPG